MLPIAAYTFATSDGELAVTFNRPGIEQIWQDKRMSYCEIAAHLAIYKAVTDGLPPPEGVEGELYRPKRIMASFSRVSQAEAFVKHHAAIMDALGVPSAEAFLYVGTTPDVDRQAVYRCVEGLTDDGRGLSHAVIAQCRALTEGFDLPDLDMALLVTDVSSTIAIQQLIGRVTRLPVRSSKRWASVVTTDITPEDLDDEAPFYSVVRALTGLSTSMRHDLYEGRKINRLGGTAPVRLGNLDGKPLPGDFTERVRLALVPGRRANWIPDFIDHLRQFKAQFGHVEVDARYVAPDGYPLGSRVSKVRFQYSDKPQVEDSDRRREVRALLANELTPLGFRWTAQGRGQDAWIPEFIDHLKDYTAEHGHATPPDRHVMADGYALGQWAGYVRRRYAPGAPSETS